MKMVSDGVHYRELHWWIFPGILPTNTHSAMESARVIAHALLHLLSLCISCVICDRKHLVDVRMKTHALIVMLESGAQISG